MGTRERILLLIVCIHLATSQRSVPAESPPPPPCSPLPYSSSLNSCPDHLISQIIDAFGCIPPSVAPPPDDDGDLSPHTGTVSDQELSPATFAQVVVRALSASTKEEGRRWEILIILMFPVAVRAVLVCEIPMRNLCPRLALERLLVILFVNATTAFLLPEEWKWVPLVCCISSLLILIVAASLPDIH